jgi:hypothetical protein
MKVVFAAAFAAVLLSSAKVEARCSAVRFRIVEMQRVTATISATPGARCTHRINARALGVAEIRVIQRPSQGAVAPASSGRGALVYQSNRGAAGQDRYVIRAEFDRINRGTGVSSGKTWAEIEYLVRFTP